MNRILAIIIMLLVAGTAFGQTARQRELERENDDTREEIELMGKPGSFQTQAYEAKSDEYKVRTYRLYLKVPARAASKGVKARKAATVATHLTTEVTHYVATTQRREAQTEAILVGADVEDAMKIDREVFEIKGDLNNKTTEMTIRYYVGRKLVASRDLRADSTGQAESTLDRIIKLDAWARANGEEK